MWNICGYLFLIISAAVQIEYCCVCCDSHSKHYKILHVQLVTAFSLQLKSCISLMMDSSIQDINLNQFPFSPNLIPVLFICPYSNYSKKLIRYKNSAGGFAPPLRLLHATTPMAPNINICYCHPFRNIF